MNTTTVSDTIVQEITIKGSAERIFAALTDPQERLKWWASGASRRYTWSRTCARAGNG
jgi:uncharacterized protein YndB with AHSA1/START domain